MRTRDRPKEIDALEDLLRRPLDAEQAQATAEIEALGRCTTLAMRAARNGLNSLNDVERRDLMCFVGFDMSVFLNLPRACPWCHDPRQCDNPAPRCAERRE